MNLSDLMANIGGSDALKQIADRAGLSQDQAQDAAHGILDHLTNGGAANEVVETVAARIGVSPDQIQSLLPQVLPLLQAHADSAAGEGEGMLGGLMGRLKGLLG
jgi:hypothetical protein